MKYIFCAIFCIFTFSIFASGQCPKNSDTLYDKQKMLEKFDRILKSSIPAYAQFPRQRFFVWDLTNSKDYYLSATNSYQEVGCINFKDNHIYHFSPVGLSDSQSHIAFLEDGKLKVFENVVCEYNNSNLEKAINYVVEKLKNDKNKNKILTRLKNYRRYGFYSTDDDYRTFCNYNKEIPENSDKLYDRWKVLNQLSDVLRNSISEKMQEQISWRFLTEESRASGFFVWDLTEPSNKQTSLLERVEFKNNHVYHFAFIDLPFSFSNIAVLEDGKLKIFKAINCKGKGDSLEDVVGYLAKKLKNDKNKDEIVGRVKNYREYGVYVPFNDLSEPQCEEVISDEK
ncbi:MAG: hypothetical protein R2681_17560 [Pyrinomonadaceae bacterium]